MVRTRVKAPVLELIDTFSRNWHWKGWCAWKKSDSILSVNQQVT